MALEFQEHHHPARIGPSPVVPLGRGGREHRDDEPVAKPVRLDAVFDDFTNEDYSEED